MFLTHNLTIAVLVHLPFSNMGPPETIPHSAMLSDNEVWFLYIQEIGTHVCDPKYAELSVCS